MLEIPIKTKFDGVETDVVVTVRKFRVPHVEGAGPRVMLDDYSVAYPNGELVSAEALDCNDTC